MKRQCLYRWFDHDHNLLYVGISRNLASRIKDHQDSSSWFDKVAYVEVKFYDSRNEVERAEKIAIVNECPEYNKMYHPGSQEKRIVKSYVSNCIQAKDDEIKWLKKLQEMLRENLERSDLLNSSREEDRKFYIKMTDFWYNKYMNLKQSR